MSDLRTIADTLVALAATEVIIKPILIRLGRTLLARLDHRLPWVPDWLHSPTNQP